MIFSDSLELYDPINYSKFIRGEFKSIPPLKKGDQGGFKYIFVIHKYLKIGKLFNHESLATEYVKKYYACSKNFAVVRSTTDEKGKRVKEIKG